jgi:putative ABC transport system permease protein
MWTIALRNVQFRRRQFLLAVVGTALVFGMALLVTGIREGFRTEAQRMLDGIGGETWAVTSSSSGPFTGAEPMLASTADELAREAGVRRADPVAMGSRPVRMGDDFQSVHVIGYRVGGLGAPPPVEGRPVATRGEVVVDKKVGLGVGETLNLAGRPFKVVGLVSDRTFYGGTPSSYIPIEDAQEIGSKGAPLITAVVMEGRPLRAPAGLKIMSEEQVQGDLLRPLGTADRSINTTRILLWIVAAVIVGAVMYMSALERVRDFAVLKAVGGKTRVLVTSLAFEAMVACLAAAGLAVAMARLLTPTIPLPITITTDAYLALPVVAVAVGVVASLFGVRRAVRTDPALAFSGA